MYRIIGNDIELTRGDSLVLLLRFGGRALAQGTQAVFTVKRRPRDEQPVLCKRFGVEDGRVTLQLVPSETDLDPRSYVWDVRLLIPQGEATEVRTPMEYAGFTIMEVIGDV